MAQQTYTPTGYGTVGGNGNRSPSAAGMRRRVIRQKLAEAAGLVKPGEVFHAYGPNKTAGADKLMQSGTGLGQGLGAAQRDSTQRLLMASRRRKGGPAGGKPIV